MNEVLVSEETDPETGLSRAITGFTFDANGTLYYTTNRGVHKYTDGTRSTLSSCVYDYETQKCTNQSVGGARDALQSFRDPVFLGDELFISAWNSEHEDALYQVSLADGKRTRLACTVGEKTFGLINAVTPGSGSLYLSEVSLYNVLFEVIPGNQAEDGTREASCELISK